MSAIPDDVKDEPASTALVWLVLDDRGPLCVGGIVEATGRSAATVRRSLRRLEDAGAVRECPPVAGRDIRYSFYETDGDPASR